MTRVTADANNLIFLIGFMGAGKTTVGKALAAKWDFQFVDLDECIEAQSGRTVPEIFSGFGEPYFRRLETESLQSIAQFKNTIVSIGGGAFESEENRNIIKAAGQSVWLDCSLDVAISRIQFDGTRPLARSKEELRDLLVKRLPIYAQADFTVQVDEKTIDEVVEAIQRILQDSRLAR
jgi:shikimate kinase